VDTKAKVEDLGRNLAKSLENFIDDGLEFSKSRDELDELEKIILSCTDLIGSELIIEDSHIVPSDTTTDGKFRSLNVDDTANSTISANIEALLPGTIVGDLSHGKRGSIILDTLSESRGCKSSNENKNKETPHFDNSKSKRSLSNNTKGNKKS